MADTFADRGNGQTLATGNIRLGQYLFLTDPADSVIYDTTTLTATGKVTILADGSTLNVVTGTFAAPITTGVAVPIGTPDDLITSAAGFVLTNVVVSDINIPIDQFSVNANLNVAVKDITITTGVDLYVSGASSGIIYSGRLGAFDFAVGGVTVTVAPSMTLSNTGIAIPSAVITLPVSLGGASSTINNLTITSEGLMLDDGTITLPDIKWGDGSKVKLIQPIAHLSVLTETYQFSANGTLSLTLPSNNLTTTLGFTLTQGGQMTGTLSNLNLTVAGAMLTMTDIAVSNSGLSVDSADLQLPASLGSGTANLSNVGVYSNGLNLGSGTFALPIIKIGDGSRISITNSTAQLAIADNEYDLDVTSTLNMNLPGNQLHPELGFALHAGQMTGTLSSLNLSVAGATLGMTNALISNAGFAVTTATLQLPASLGSGIADLSNVGVYSNGLNLGSGTFALPVIKIGDGSRISITNSIAQLAIANNEYDLDVTSTLNLNLPGNQLHPDLGFSLHAGQMTGTLSNLNLSIAGATLGMTNALISNAGFAVATATLQLPASLGSGTANLSNVGVYSNGLNLGSGTFALPVIKIGDGSRISITNSIAQLAIANNEYDLDVTSTLNLNLPGNQLHPELGFALHAGQMTGTLSSLNLSVAGATLGMTNALISNAGFAVATATLQLPASLGNAVTTLNDVSIGADGLTLGNGTFSLPVIKIGDGQRISITQSLAQLSIGNDQYQFAVTGTLNLNLPSNALTTTLGFAMQNGQMTGTLSSLHLTMAGSTLVP